MRKFYSVLLTMMLMLITCGTTMQAQQVPNPGFEDWSGEKFDGNDQPKDWYGSNISQMGINFNLTNREAGHSGSYCVMVKDTEVGALGITELSPGYFSLGKPWSYLSGLDTKTATAGTSGGIKFTNRPDSMSVWIKRTGPRVTDEDFYLLYYAWSGTAKGDKYKAKGGGCSSVSQTNEESDVRLALDANECGTTQQANQIAEGMWREKKEYGQWTNIRVPIYYFNNDVPSMMNIIFSASNYPNYRAKDGLYKDNALYVDDIELIYSSKIDKLYIGGKEWKGFDPNSTEEQTYSLGRSATAIPEISAVRGVGSITNARGTTVSFPGRQLTGKEISITNGEIDGTPCVITVTSEDGKATTTYRIKFAREASTNAKLANILVNGKGISNFQPALYNYTVELPYGTTETPVISVEAQEDEQTIAITQPTSTTGTATVLVTAADKKTTATYTIQFKVALLADNTLKDIKINGNSVSGFTPNQTTYRVSLPTTTTTMPLVEAISAYPEGEQIIEHIQPSTIDGGVYQISVKTPGNPTPKIYKLNFKLEASDYSLLKSLQMGDNLIPDFDPTRTTYYVDLPIGTTSLPKITYEKGESTQTVTVQEGGLDGVTKVLVVAGNGINQTEYKIVVSTAKSEISSLNMIYVGGEPLSGFAPNITSYTCVLPIGTTQLPEIIVDKGDEYQTVNILKGGVNGTTRITVTAQNGSSTIYQITFSVHKATDASLKMIYLDGQPLEGFDPKVLEYNCPLPKGTTQLPVITYDQADEYQTVTTRSGGVNGDYKITVRPQTGASQTYILHFSVAVSDNANLSMLYLDGNPLAGFNPDTLNYTYTLPMGVTTIPTVTFDKAEDTQKVLNILSGNVQTIKVTAESGKTQTYTITFIIQRSESAFLKMIYLDGDSLMGFDKNVFDYTVTLQTTTCPVITVDKEEGQQITITTPRSVGQAKIVVKPESSAANTYTINFVNPQNKFVLLQNIYIDGTPLAGFDPNQFFYSVTCANSNPTITYDALPEQQVEIFRQGNIATIYVVSGEHKAQYEITLSVTPNTDCTLRSIMVDSVLLPDFQPSVFEYTVALTDKSATPIITFEKQYAEQVVYAGMLNAQTYSLLVLAQSGDTARYNLHLNRQLSGDADLINMQLDGVIIDFQPTTYEYIVSLPEGYELPYILVETKPGQDVALHNLSNTEQQVIVTAENGNSNTYRIIYDRQKSSNAWLADILIDGVSLDGFEATTYEYTNTLAWRTKVVPCVQPIGSHPDQTITTYHSAIDGTTTIEVIAADDTTKQIYTIQFPVVKSSNTALEFIMLDHDVVSINYQPNTTDYYIAMPYGETSAPIVLYQETEPEQEITFISRPLGQTTEIIVTAENGDQRTYSLHFQPTWSSAANRLASLSIAETGATLDVNTPNQTIALPYGTRTMTVNYTKQFAEQTVWVQPGGVHQPTIITIKSNRPDEEDMVYTLTPQVDSQDPAVLTEISINGTPLEGFDSNRFTYIAKVETNPIIRYQVKQGASINITEQTNKHWQAEVTYEGRTNTYDVWYYYTNDQVPNTEFTEWTNCLTYTDAVKPTGWNTIADVLGTHEIFIIGKFNPDQMVQKSGNDAVYLKTPYSTPGGGNIPGFITLGNVSGQWGVAGSSSFNINGGIAFRNTPDQMAIRYYNAKVKGNSLIQYSLTGMNGVKTLEWKDSETGSEYKEVLLDLSEANVAAGAPSALNITLCSFNSIDGATNTALNTAAEMYVDYLRFTYNSQLTGLTINGEAANMDGNTFTYTLADSQDVLLPTLAFTGEVADQAQLIVWGEETKADGFATRIAAITNYAEDGSSTDYTLELRRPLDTNNTLADLLVGGNTISAFDANKTEYTYHLASTTKQLPDLQPIAGSSLQHIATSFADSTMTIVVTPESGEATTYTVRFVTDLSEDVTLASINVEGANIVFDPLQTEYTISADRMPAITFVKQMDGQTVELHNGVLTVTAENGAQGTYTIHVEKPVIVTTGQLADLEIDGVSLQSFNSNTYEYTLAQPQTVGFKRVFDTDSVIFVQTPLYMEWQVYGDEQHTYRITYPSELSSNTQLKAFYINSAVYEEFNPLVYDYTYYTDEPVHIHAVANEKALSMAVEYTQEGDIHTYTYIVTAEDGTVGQPYTLTVRPNLDNSPYLQGILLDGKMVADFHAEKLNYTITLPTGAYKSVEPTLPSISYILGAPRQQVVIEHGNLGETTNIVVTAEDGSLQAVYQLLIEAEPSHCTSLTGIAVNGVPIEHFTSQRHYYSVESNEEDVVLTWSSNDNFQTVTQTTDGYAYTLNVLAQDGISSSTYTVEVYTQGASSDVTLAQILLNGKTFDLFEPALNPGLAFSPMQQRYAINLPAGSHYLPEVTARLNAEGQTVEITSEGTTISIKVTAADGISTNTYTLLFAIPQSSNAHLKMVYLDGEPLANFVPEHYNYFIDLPLGQTTMPDVYAEPQEAVQTVHDSITGNLQHTIYVTAEDGTKRQYLLAFQLNPSKADTLMAIYGDGILIDGFRPDSFYYAYNLPVGTDHIPELSWDESDRWQTITANNAYESNLGRITQIQVVSMAGTKNTYTVSYTIEQSSVDTLQMIYIQSDSLLGFDAHTNDYYINLAPGDSVAPSVAWQEGDVYQTVSADLQPYMVADLQIGWKQVLTVQAQNGQVRVYTVYFLFTRVLSTNTDLLNIYINGQPLEGFTPERYSYTYLVPEGGTLPSVLVEKSEAVQTVEIEHGDLTRIVVTAEDAQYQATYTITFNYQQSPYSYLEGIFQDGVLLEGFRPDSFYYDVTLPYGTTTLPNFTYEIGKEEQTVSVDTFVVELGEQTQTTFRFSVTAPDPMFSSEYDVRVIVAFNDNCRLQALNVRGNLIEGFNPDTTNYTLIYPIGTDSTELATISDIQAIAEDVNATVTITANGVNFLIQVDAQDGEHSCVYTVEQVILLSDNARLSAILLDSTLLRHFDPEHLEYTYYIVDAQPTIEAIAEDPNATIEYSMYALNEPFYIYVTAHDGTERIYTIYFMESTIDASQTPNESDVIIKHIAGTMDFVAATIRKNVSIGVYSEAGHLIYYNKISETTQNDATIGTNADGSDRLMDVYESTLLFSLPEVNRTFFYVFFENEKRRIASGKIMIRK